MKINRKFQNIIEKMSSQCFDKDGKLDEAKVALWVKALKALPRWQAVVGLMVFMKSLKRELNRTTLEVHSAVELSDAEIKEIVKKIELDHPVTQVETKVSSSILGGLRVKISDWVYDDSVSRKILQIKEVAHA